MEKHKEAKPDKHFWFVNGESAKSLKEMAEKLKVIDNDSFRYHVNKDKNDVANWIHDVIGDEHLAKKLHPNLKKHEFIHIIDEHLGIKPELELPSLSEHIKHRRVGQIKELLEEINYKIMHHSDILDKYEKVRDLYKQLDKDNKRIVYEDVVKTYNKMQEIWSRINY